MPLCLFLSPKLYRTSCWGSRLFWARSLVSISIQCLAKDKFHLAKDTFDIMLFSSEGVRAFTAKGRCESPVLNMNDPTIRGHPIIVSSVIDFDFVDMLHQLYWIPLEEEFLTSLWLYIKLYIIVPPSQLMMALWQSKKFFHHFSFQYDKKMKRF